MGSDNHTNNSNSGSGGGDTRSVGSSSTKPVGLVVLVMGTVLVAFSLFFTLVFVRYRVSRRSLAAGSSDRPHSNELLILKSVEVNSSEGAGSAGPPVLTWGASAVYGGSCSESESGSVRVDMGTSQQQQQPQQQRDAVAGSYHREGARHNSGLFALGKWEGCENPIGTAASAPPAAPSTAVTSSSGNFTKELSDWSVGASRSDFCHVSSCGFSLQSNLYPPVGAEEDEEEEGGYRPHTHINDREDGGARGSQQQQQQEPQQEPQQQQQQDLINYKGISHIVQSYYHYNNR